jgi:dipeptidyl aminopeptidase/acylaminoacyl peptidase
MKCSDIFGFTQIAEAVLAPGGDAVAFTMRSADPASDSYVFELRVAPVPGRPWPGIRGTAGQGLRYPAWAPDGHRLAAGDGCSVVVLNALDGTRRRVATAIAEATSITWSPDGREVAFLSTEPADRRAENAREPVLITNLAAKIDGLGIASAWRRHLFVVNCQTGALRQLTTGDLWVEDFCYSASGNIAFCASEPMYGLVPRQPGAIRPCGVWLLDPDGGAARPVTAADASARCPVFAADGSVVYVGLPELRAEQPGLFAIAAGGGPPRRLAGGLDRGIVTSIAGFLGGHRPVATPRGEILFCARDGGCAQLYQTWIDDPARVRKIAGSAAESVGAVSVSRGGETFAYVSSTADGCQRLVAVNTASGTGDVLARTEPPGDLIEPVPQQFTARDGVALEGWLIRGPAAGPTQLLIDVHGGSFSGAWSPLTQPSRLYQQELVARGWTVLLLNARGSDGYGSRFATSVVGAWGAADAPDFHDAIDALVSMGLADPARLAVTGYSYGGFMTNWLTATSDRFSAAVSGGSISDFVSLFGTSDMGWQMSEYDIGVHPQADPVRALQCSPAGQGRPVRTPTLLLHGEADLRCPISQAEQWLAVLLSSGCEAALVRYPGASHGFLTSGRPSIAADYGNRLVQWITGHVPGGPAAEAALAEAAHRSGGQMGMQPVTPPATSASTPEENVQ